MSSLITHNLSSSVRLLGDAFYLSWSSSVCQYLPEEDPADCLSGLSSVASLSLWWAQLACFAVCCWSACLLVFCWCLSEFNWCLLKFFWRLFLSVCSSVRLFKEGLAGVCLDWVRVSSISFWWTHQVLLEVSPTVCLSVSPSGILGFLLGGLVGAFDVCCSVFPDSPIHRDWVLSFTLYHPFIWVFSLFLMKLAFTLLLSL